VAAADGTEPRILLASATIANPVELAERLTGLDAVELIERDGSPSAGRRIVVWNPPVIDAALGIRRSALSEAAELLARLVREGARTICFVRSRKGVELLSRLVTLELERSGDSGLAELVTPYRAGYTPGQRREIEGRLAAGELRAVVTTDALELGIDVGALDAALVVSFPGTIASLRQMWGRAGRRRRGLALYIASEDALDQFFARHPDEFLDRPVESAILDHESEEIHLAQLLCAAHEGPLSEADGEFFGPRTLAYLERLEGLGELREKNGTFVLRRRERYPAGEVSLRSASPDTFAIVDVSTGELLGSTESARACSTLHPGAIYLHMGRPFHVLELDFDVRRAVVEPFHGDWYTQPKRETDTLIERLLDRRETLGVTLSFGRVLVTETVLAYQRRGLPDHQEIDLVALELPPSRFATQALWFELDAATLDGFPAEILLGALHATEHAQIAVLPLMAMCDRWDIGGLSTNAHPQTGGPTIFIHDGHPGGVGITRLAFAHFEELVANAQRLIAECGCREGCPSCVQSPKCGNLNEPLSKAGATELLGRLLARADG
jgi:DEAD/DEAH box helicase domain-containing protein